jgi:hypothetical protein
VSVSRFGSDMRRASLIRVVRLLCIAVVLVQGGTRAQLLPNLGGQRVGISAFQFLKIGVGARGVAMGESFSAVANDVSALYYNPAGLAQMADNQAMASHTQYVVELQHEFFGAAVHLTENDVIGASFIVLHTADMEVTTETQPFGTGRYFSFGDIAIGCTYARKMTDQFSFGVTLRYAEETMDVLKMRGFLFDLGTYYWTGLGTTRFAVVISNFGGDVAPEGSVTELDGREVATFQAFSVPTVFRLGFAIDPINTEEHRLTGSFQLNHPNDNSEHIRLGLEYGWRSTLFLRAGVKRTLRQQLLQEDQTSAESYAAGLGVRLPLGFSTVSADYAYSDFSQLGAVHRISLSMTF